MASNGLGVMRSSATKLMLLLLLLFKLTRCQEFDYDEVLTPKEEYEEEKRRHRLHTVPWWVYAKFDANCNRAAATMTPSVPGITECRDVAEEANHNVFSWNTATQECHHVNCKHFDGVDNAQVVGGCKPWATGCGSDTMATTEPGGMIILAAAKNWIPPG